MAMLVYQRVVFPGFTKINMEPENAPLPLEKEKKSKASFSGSMFFFAGCTWRIIPISKWLITIVIISPLRIGSWDPFQMA